MRATANRELLRGQFVLVRLTEECDAEQIVGWRNAPEAARWLYQWKPLTVQDHLAWFRKARERGDLLVNFETLEGEAVGCSSIHAFDHEGTSAECGRICAARVGGNPAGMYEGLYLLHRLCFEALGMVRTWSRVATENERSWHLFQSLGYVEEGVLRKHWIHPNGYDDVHVAGLFPDEFREARKALEAKLYGSGPAPEISAEVAARIREQFARRFD
jgi:RimJ/RimL family protein N-acetyltransferase